MGIGPDFPCSRKEDAPNPPIYLPIIIYSQSFFLITLINQLHHESHVQICFFFPYMGYPKWMVQWENYPKMDDFWGTPHFRNLNICTILPVRCFHFCERTVIHLGASWQSRGRGGLFRNVQRRWHHDFNSGMGNKRSVSIFLRLSPLDHPPTFHKNLVASRFFFTIPDGKNPTKRGQPEFMVDLYTYSAWLKVR